MSTVPAFPVLLDSVTIRERIRALAQALERDHERIDDLLLICVVEGARTFARHLVGRLSARPEVREVGASSYLDGTVSSGKVRLAGAGEVDVTGRRVVIVEDIVDTGRTVDRLRREFLARGAHDVQVVTLLSKPARRVIDVDTNYVGFEIDDHFVIGFGMDIDGRYRELPHVAIYDERLERAAQTGT